MSFLQLYDLSSFIADSGSYLGLLLGMSLIDVFKTVVAGLQRAIKMVNGGGGGETKVTGDAANDVTIMRVV